MSAVQCQAMVDHLCSYAPVLRPRICPKGLEDDGLLHLCQSEAQGESLSAVLAALQMETDSCTVCQSKGMYNVWIH